MTDPIAPADPESALPSVRARVVAFASILAAGGLGGAVAYWFVELQCDDTCTVGAGFAMMGGTLAFAVGAAIVAVLSLRALAEWNATPR